jgi:lipoprotein-anchoring transpeptidase ErfK/SrfK
MNLVHRIVLVCGIVIAAATLGARELPLSPLKRVEVDKTEQVLRAFEGDRLVFFTRISTGKGNSTPNGTYYAQEKQRMHYSRRYDNAPMPFSVQVSGHYFIHGFTSVPPWPASHGCIRVPLNRGNPARLFYEWVEIGTPIDIVGYWRGQR